MKISNIEIPIIASDKKIQRVDNRFRLDFTNNRRSEVNDTAIEITTITVHIENKSNILWISFKILYNTNTRFNFFVC